MQKALYCFTNMVLQQKVRMPFRDFVQASLPDTDAEEILNTMEYADDSTYECLPAGDEDEDTSGDEEEEEEVATLGTFEPRDGFAVMDRPQELLAGTVLKGLFVAMLWSTGWEIGMVKRFNPKRQRYNYDITWTEGTRGSALELSDYYVVPPAGENVALGSWMYLRKSAIRDSDDAKIACGL